MKGQPHFVESPEPIPSGQDYSALCGKVLVNAYFYGAVPGDEVKKHEGELYGAG
jgi:hypothetical protein